MIDAEEDAAEEPRVAAEEEPPADNDLDQALGDGLPRAAKKYLDVQARRASACSPARDTYKTSAPRAGGRLARDGRAGRGRQRAGPRGAFARAPTARRMRFHNTRWAGSARVRARPQERFSRALYVAVACALRLLQRYEQPEGR